MSLDAREYAQALFSDYNEVDAGLMKEGRLMAPRTDTLHLDR